MTLGGLGDSVFLQGERRGGVWRGLCVCVCVCVCVCGKEGHRVLLGSKSSSLGCSCPPVCPSVGPASINLGVLSPESLLCPLSPPPGTCDCFLSWCPLPTVP